MNLDYLKKKRQDLCTEITDLQDYIINKEHELTEEMCNQLRKSIRSFQYGWVILDKLVSDNDEDGNRTE